MASLVNKIAYVSLSLMTKSDVPAATYVRKQHIQDGRVETSLTLGLDAIWQDVHTQRSMQLFKVLPDGCIIAKKVPHLDVLPRLNLLEDTG